MKYFKTPSDKIACAWVYGGSPTAPGMMADGVVCEVTSGLKPLPYGRPSCKHPDNLRKTAGLPAEGQAVLGLPCSEYTIFADAYERVPGFVLKQGKSLKDGYGMVCSEAKTGLTCRNRSGHGFFLSPSRWHTF